ncbi:hypothetical protein BDY19DRAFT_2429 [Irpex rosettiformis]|uniref:Uncharacterized protein n=1 Tax=Irpex rosettiformis TaxID=378272 RepID=A0ACB8UID5_9APHY|nr:hypothetical protein BDY19DRAFT_2429 [Irpex rosettiformis]
MTTPKCRRTLASPSTHISNYSLLAVPPISTQSRPTTLYNRASVAMSVSEGLTGVVGLGFNYECTLNIALIVRCCNVRGLRLQTPTSSLLPIPIHKSSRQSQLHQLTHQHTHFIDHALVITYLTFVKTSTHLQNPHCQSTTQTYARTIAIGCKMVSHTLFVSISPSRSPLTPQKAKEKDTHNCQPHKT